MTKSLDQTLKSHSNVHFQAKVALIFTNKQFQKCRKVSKIFRLKIN